MATESEDLPRTPASLYLEKELLPYIKALVASPAAPLEHMSASWFFGLLFFNSDINSQLSSKSKIVVGNALSWAFWKETVEYTIMHENPLFPMGDYSDPAVLYHAPDLGAQEAAFTAFCNRQLPEQVEGVHKPGYSEASLRRMLSISPWCGAGPVLRILREAQVRVGLVQEPSLRSIMESLLGEPGQAKAEEANLRYLLSANKRKREYQYVIGQVAACLKPFDSQKELHERAVQLRSHCEIIDVSHTLGGVEGWVGQLFKQ